MPSTGWQVNGNVITITNKVDGIFNFTSVYIETNWTVKFTHNILNTPVYILATTDVTIRGTIDLTGSNTWLLATNGIPGGPGGFDGGTAALGLSCEMGFGPGGGFIASDCTGGGGGFASYGGGETIGPPPYGTVTIEPFIGGSGGSTYSQGGGGGGGAILIASSTTIDVEGLINVNGGMADGSDCYSGGGSGGAIKLKANTIQGAGSLTTYGGHGQGGCLYTYGSNGRIRIEACNQGLQILVPSTIGAPTNVTFGVPDTVFLNNNPAIWVSSVAGQSSPAPPTGSMSIPDLHLGTNFVNPVLISVAASNINSSTSFQVVLTPITGTNRIATGTLSGSYGFSTGTVSIAVYTDRVWRANALISYIPRP
jgi:hypothetical protein